MPNERVVTPSIGGSYPAPTQNKISYSWKGTSKKDTDVCRKQKIPVWPGSPLLPLNRREDVTPIVCHKSVVIHPHQQEAVMEGLECQVRMGIIERVLLNMPVQQPSKIVCTPKQDVLLQRSVNYNMVNTQNPQQTHQTLHPGPLVSFIAGRIYKSVLSNQSWISTQNFIIKLHDRILG